jgi:heptosyltransferase-2
MTNLLRRSIDSVLLPGAARLVGEPFFRLLGQRRKKGEIDPSQVRNVLVVRLDEIGDVLLTSPFLRELRRMLPRAWITLVVKPGTFNLVELCPYVNEVLTYDWEVVRPGTRFPLHAKIFAFARRLRLHARAIALARKHLWRRRFDLAILPRWDVDVYHASYVVYFSGAPWRLGYSSAVTAGKCELNAGLDRLFTHVLRDDQLKHQAEHNLDVLRYLGAKAQDTSLELWLADDDETFAERTFAEHEVPSGEAVIAFGISARHAFKTWPLANFVALGRRLQREGWSRILVLAGSDQAYLGEQLQQDLGGAVINMAGRTTIRQAAALLKRCQLYIGNDSGPMHLAAAAGAAVVEISCYPRSANPAHPNSPARFRPWSEDFVVLQPEEPVAPCMNACVWHEPHCILGVSVDSVYQAARDLLQPRQAVGSEKSRASH